MSMVDFMLYKVMYNVQVVRLICMSWRLEEEEEGAAIRITKEERKERSIRKKCINKC